MNKMILRILKIITFICILVLLLEGLYFLYLNYFRKDSASYFDSINDFCYYDDKIIAVGSNNGNDKDMEKAKITKYNAKKEKVWEVIYNKGYESTYYGVGFDGSDIIAVGSYESNKRENKESLRTALIVKYDSSGNVIFEEDFQVLDNSKFTNILVVSDGYIVTGQSVYDDMTLGSSNEGGAFILKYNKEGKLLWKSNFGNSKTAVYNNLVCYNDYIYAVGKSDSNTGIISKYDFNGNMLGYSLCDNCDTFGFSGITVSNGELVVCGAKVVSSDDKANTDALIVKYDLNGNYIGEVLYDSASIERFNEIITDDDNNLIVVGTISNYKKDNDSKFVYNGLIGKYHSDLKKVSVLEYGDEQDDYFTNIKIFGRNYLVSGYSSYDKDGYLSKFITYSDALKVLEVS